MEVPATFLPPAGDPRKATVRYGGVVWTPAVAGSRRVHLVTWNTGDIDPPGNSSHAEHQFVNWLEHKERTAPGFMESIEEITVNNFTRSPCSECGPELAHVLKEIKAVRKEPVKASIAWTTLHSTGAQPTTWQSLNTMRKAGWTLCAPGTALPPEENVQRVLVRLIYRR